MAALARWCMHHRLLAVLLWLLALGGVPGHVVVVIQRTFYASGRAVETADVVVPADRYRVAYHLPVK